MNPIEKLKELGYDLNFSLDKDVATSSNVRVDDQTISCIVKVTLTHADKDDYIFSVPVSGWVKDGIATIITEGVSHYISFLFFSEDDTKEEKEEKEEPKEYLAADVLNDFFAEFPYQHTLDDLFSKYGQYESITKGNGWLGLPATKEQIKAANFGKLVSLFNNALNDAHVTSILTHRPDIGYSMMLQFAEMLAVLDGLGEKDK